MKQARTRMLAMEQAPRKRRSPAAWLGAAVGGVALALLIIVVVSRDSSDPRPTAGARSQAGDDPPAAAQTTSAGAAGGPTPSSSAAVRAPTQVIEASGSAPRLVPFSLDPAAKSVKVIWDMRGDETNSITLNDLPEARNPMKVVTKTGPTKGERTFPRGADVNLGLFVDGHKEWKVTVIQYFG